MSRLQNYLLSLLIFTTPPAAKLLVQPASSGPDFAVASVKPTPPNSQRQLRLDYCRADGGFAVSGAPLIWSLKYAFDLPEYAIADVPHWLGEFDSAYDIEAKPDGEADKEHCQAMLRSLFSERFHLLTHHERRLTSVLFLRPLGTAPKLKSGGGVHLNHSLQVNGDGTPEWPDGWTMGQLARFLSNVLERPVIDQTGLLGTYGITLDYTRNNGEDGRPDLLTAVREQLGLKLSSGKAQIDMLVIDHIQKPDPN